MPRTQTYGESRNPHAAPAAVSTSQLGIAEEPHAREGVSMRRKHGNSRELSSSPEEQAYIDVSDDSEELSTADLTISILAKAEKRKAEKRQRNKLEDGTRREVVVLESEDSGREEAGGAAPLVEELEEGELNDAAKPEPEVEREAAVAISGRKRKKEKKEKRKKNVGFLSFIEFSVCFLQF